MISKMLQILNLQPRISKVFPTRTIVSHSRSEQCWKQNTITKTNEYQIYQKGSVINKRKKERKRKNSTQNLTVSQRKKTQSRKFFSDHIPIQ